MATYSFIDVSANIVGPGGAFALGYGEAAAKEGITIAMANEKNTMLMGGDGNGIHTLRADKSGTVTLRYLKTAPINTKLMLLYDAQSLSSALWGLNTIVIKQNVSGDITTAVRCAFHKKPDLNYKEDADTIEWVFDAIAIDTILGSYTQ
ncbi:phage protein [Chitinasiproducens palmae]|uniref:DUF3277 family protein n=1 Tax=Chitinasiproducens palmae TaxID=1770053 RepID=A0A1H2PQL1_9BURK|nr:phage protein [Chitinasiproducens palmae]SDV49081.1 Protein of unknown function [Chitinasiproducens palmae]